MTAHAEFSYARAVTDYWAENPGELSCSINDVIRVVRKESRQLLLAENLVTSTYGSLPTYCVAPFEVPETAESNPVFAAIKDFDGVEEGDLSFVKGDFIIGDYAVDRNWWHGWKRSMQGIFPLQWVRQLKRGDVPVQGVVTENLPELQARKGEQIVILGHDHITGCYTGLSTAGVFGSFPESFVNVITPNLANGNNTSLEFDLQSPYQNPAAGVTDTVSLGSSTALLNYDESRPRGRAIYAFESGLPNELNFRSGTIVFFGKEIDDNWIEGELENGQRGIFPRNFVETIVELPPPLPTVTVSNIVSHENGSLEDFPPDTYGIVLLDHTAQHADELSLRSGDTVTLLKKRGDDWIEAMDDFGNSGFCPIGCLEIIGSEPDEVRTLSQSDLSPHGSLESLRSSETSPSPTWSLDSHDVNNKRASWQESEHVGANQQHPVGRQLQVENGSHHDLALKRSKVTEEIIATEKEYIYGLNVCLTCMLEDDPPGKFNLSVILGNLDQVLQVAGVLLRELCLATADNGQIGECFLRNMSSLRTAYVAYCQNNASTIGLLSQYKDDEELAAYMNRKVADIRLKTNCFDLASMFIKPLQRILKYPLLLAELLKATERLHADYIFVKDCLRQITDLASSINELKRRKELVAKYRDNGAVSFGERLSRLSFHSVVKKSSRLGLLVSSTIGFTSLMQDPAFQAEERRFQVTKRTIKWFLRNLAEFIEQLQELMVLQNTIVGDFSVILKDTTGADAASVVIKREEAVSGNMLQQLVPNINAHVILPLEDTLKKFQGPSNLISKRFAKLIDFENIKRKLDRLKEGQRTPALLEEVELAKKVYLALNAQLMDELPKFNDVASRILSSRLEAFLHFRKIFFYTCSNDLLPCVSGNGNPRSNDTGKQFAKKLSSVLTDLKKFDYGATVSVTVTDKVVPLRRADSVAGNASVEKSSRPPHAKVLQSTSMDVISSRVANVESFRITEDYFPKDNFELRARRDDVVEVLKKHDPMGNNDQWFVSLSGSKGFLPKRILLPQAGVRRSAPPPTPLSTRPATIAAPVVITGDSFHEAAFAFVPYGPCQLALNANDRVTVVTEHDLDGNAEWWYVMDRHGAKGFVPSAYLRRSN